MRRFRDCVRMVGKARVVPYGSAVGSVGYRVQYRKQGGFREARASISFFPQTTTTTTGQTVVPHFIGEQDNLHALKGNALPSHTDRHIWGAFYPDRDWRKLLCGWRSCLGSMEPKYGTINILAERNFQSRGKKYHWYGRRSREF